MRLLILVLLGALAIWPNRALADKAADEAKAARFTRENFDKIQPGASKDDVNQILGKSSTASKAGKDETLHWRIGTNRKQEIVVKFHDGVVVSKKSTFDWADGSATVADAAKPVQLAAKGEYPWTMKSDDADTPPSAVRINFTHSPSRSKGALTIKPIESAVASPLVMIMDIDINTLISGHALDLRSGQEKPLFSGVKLWLGEPQISPNLQYIATKGDSHMGKEYANTTDDITVWDLPQNKQLSHFPSKVGKLEFVKVLGFISNDQILMSQFTAGSMTLKIGDVHSGQMVREFALPRGLKVNSDRSAFSPSGKYWATTDGGHLAVLDLSAGEVAGYIKIAPDGQSKARAAGIAFSPTGKQIAIIGEANGQHWLVLVDSATGQISQNILGDEFEATTDAFGKHLTGVDLNGHNTIEWLPNGKAVRFGQEILDLATGKVLARFTHNSADGKLQYARVLSDATILVFDQTFAVQGKFMTQAIAFK